jgi:class 3 adenylate cyclase/predicted ATPase
VDEKSLNLGQLAEDFAKLLVDVPSATTPAEQTINLEEGERREVTILFLDLVGYTRLAERLDPEQLKFVISNTLQVFTNQIKKCGGVVEKYVGDAIMALFGRAQAHEDDSRRAVVAARAIIDRLVDINSILEQKDISISARIGINRGLIVTGHLGGHDTVTGEAINIAQRLEANAPQDGILISDAVFADCEKFFRCEALPPMYVKNKTEPLTVFRIIDEISQGERRRQDTVGPFVGRDDELSVLRSAWKKARGGQMSVAQIIGEAGVGKRALVKAFLRSLEDEGQKSNPIFVQTDSFGLAPYHALSDIVRDYLEASGAKLEVLVEVSVEETDESLPDYLIYLQDLIGLPLRKEDQQQLEQMEPRARQVETVLAVKRFLQAAAMHERQANTQPLVIVLDHLEWVTHASRDSLAQILRTMPQHSEIVWIFTARDAEAARWIPDLASSTKLSLCPLDREATQSLLEARLGEDAVTKDIIKQIYDRTGGNPFFIDEVTRAIEAMGPDVDVRQLSLAEQVPGSIKALVLSRLDGLPRHLKFALQVAAVAGREFTADLLHHILSCIQYEYDADQVLNDLQQEKLILQEGEELRIVRPMVTDVAYTTILYANRRKLHKMVARYVEECRSDSMALYAPYLAGQWERAEEYEKSVAYCLQAGVEARTRYAYRDAARFFERALQLREQATQAMTDERCADILIELINLDEALGEPEKWQKHLLDGRRYVQEGTQQWASLRLREITHENRFGNRQEAPGLLEKFIASSDLQEYHELHLRALLIAAHFSQERGQDDTKYIEAAEALRPQIRNRELIYLLDNNIFNHYKNADELKKAEEYFTRVLQAQSKDAYTQHTSYLLFCSFKWDRGIDFAEMIEKAKRAEHYFSEIGWVRGIGWGAFYHGAGLWRMGRFAAAEVVYKRVLKIFERSKDDYMMELLELLLAASMLFRGDMMGYQVRKKRLLDRAKGKSDAEQKALRREFAMFEGQALEERHALLNTHEELHATRDAPIAKVQQDEYFLTIANVAAMVGRMDEAKEYADKVRDHVRENEKSWLIGLLCRVDALVASAENDCKAMQRAFAESVVKFQEVGAAYSCYRSYQAWMRALRQHRLESSPDGAKVQDGLNDLKAWAAREGITL